MQEKINQIKAMMKYLLLQEYTIPAFGLHFPICDELNGNYRPDKVWKISSSGKLSYRGMKSRTFGIHFSEEILISNIEPTEAYREYIEAAHSYLLADCTNVIRGLTKLSAIEHLDLLLKTFHGLEFVDLNSN